MMVSITLRRMGFSPGSGRRGPGLVIAGGRLPLAAFERVAGRAIGRRRPGQVRQMLLLPRIAQASAVLGRVLDRVMQPAMPFWRHLGSLRLALVDDPAALVAALDPARRAVI